MVAPTKNEEFERYWNLFEPDVIARENFKNGHLEQLKILCKLYQEFYDLTAIIDEKGAVYETDPEGESRYGNQIKVHPACTLRDKTLMEIRQYSKLLGLVLEKDQEKNGKPKEENEWD